MTATLYNFDVSIVCCFGFIHLNRKLNIKMSSTSDINDIPQLNVVYLLTHKSCRICLREEGNNVFLGNKFEVNIPGRPYERITVKEALKVLFPLVEEQVSSDNFIFKYILIT